MPGMTITEKISADRLVAAGGFLPYATAAMGAERR